MTSLAITTFDSDGKGFVLVGFLMFVVVALFLTTMGGPDEESTTDFHVGSRTLTALKNGVALSGTYLATSLLLTVTGAVALAGFDGITLAVGLLLSLGVLVLIGRPLGQSGALTLGDLFALRGPGSAPRIAGGVATLVVTFPFLVIQLNNAGSITAQLLGLPSIGARQVCTVMLGGLVILCAMLGGMKGLTLVQVLSAVVTLVSLAAATLALTAHFHGDLDSLLVHAAEGSGQHDEYLQPGNLMGRGAESRLDMFGLQLVLVLGTACMPHVLLRMHTTPDGATARRSVRNAALIVAAVCLMLVLLGLGAAAVVGGASISSAGGGDAALLLISHSLLGGSSSVSGNLLFTAVACAAFLTVLSVVGGTTVAAASSVTRDIYVHAIRRGRATGIGEVPAARVSVIVLGSFGIIIAAALQGLPVAVGAQLVTGLAASSVLPALVYSLYWRGFNRTGLLWAIYGGTAVALTLAVSAPSVSGGPEAIFTHSDFAWFPLRTPGLVSIPVGFLLGLLGSRMGRSRTTPADERRRVGAETLLLIGAEEERTS